MFVILKWICRFTVWFCSRLIFILSYNQTGIIAVFKTAGGLDRREGSKRVFLGWTGSVALGGGGPPVDQRLEHQFLVGLYVVDVVVVLHHLPPFKHRGVVFLGDNSTLRVWSFVIRTNIVLTSLKHLVDIANFVIQVRKWISGIRLTPGD